MSQHSDIQSRPLINRPPIERTAELKDGTIVLLRSLQKKDEPSITDMFRRCTCATLHQRFLYSFKLTPEWFAARYLFDRAREITIVAENNIRGSHRFAGLAQLAFTPDRESAEFGVLITDDWQGKGLGSLMTRHCLELARDRDAKSVTATTTLNNYRMIKVFVNEGFKFDGDWTDGVIRVRKEMPAPTNPSRDSHWEVTRWQRSA